ncbi:hypothetical protein O3M35_010173 [Rhynocoris fuscipes]|uniref:Ig-like domain-containing protein n=1 Tax=Rhynocoris fuscipes TaxID=488301 RepID=A0AAW1D3D6_9HEMI
MHCKAEGLPEPQLIWYKDGEIVTAAPHRVILQGDLFFLRVNNGRKDNDAGVYWCVATNTVGSARSRNATLDVAGKINIILAISFIYFEAVTLSKMSFYNLSVTQCHMSYIVMNTS